VTIIADCARRRARREHASVVRAAEARRSRRARLTAIGHEGGAHTLDASHARRALKLYARAVVDERLLRRAPARRIRRIALRLEHREARLLGRAQTEDLFLAATVGGVRDGDAIRGCRTGSIERQDGLTRAGAARAPAAVGTSQRARATRAGADGNTNTKDDEGLKAHRGSSYTSIAHASAEREIRAFEGRRGAVNAAPASDNRGLLASRGAAGAAVAAVEAAAGLTGGAAG